jgi:putative ABC transport system permease protein
MLKRYFTTTLRYLWRHRLFTALNIAGLAVSISAAWIIFRIVDYEFGYDKGLPNKDNIYRVVTGFIFDEKESYNGGVSAPIYQGVREHVRDLDYAVPVLGKSVSAVEVNTATGKPLIFDDPKGIVATDSTYFSMIPYHWILGNKSTAFNAPDNVVLTIDAAKKYFPGKKPEEIFNHRLTYYSYSDTIQRTITGIVAELDTPTEFTAREFCSLPTKAYALNSWTNTNGTDKLYLQLKQGAQPTQVLSQIQALVDQKSKEFDELRATQNKTAQKPTTHFKYKRWLELLPLKESHFSTFVKEYDVRKASKPVLYGLIGIGLFLLVLACINYINMSVAGMPQRAKEIGVRKTLGSSHAQLIGQCLAETLITAVLAAIFAQALGLLGFRLLKDTIPAGVAPLGGGMLQLLAFIVVVSVVITILAGIYPGFLITKVKTINVFRNFSGTGNVNHKFSLQKVLIVFQFIIALFFVTSAIIVSNQLHYTLTTDMGFNKDAVVLVDIPWKYAYDKKYADKQFPLFTEFKRTPGVYNISLGSAPMQSGYSSSPFEYVQDGKEPVIRQVFKKWVDTAFLNVYEIPLLAGRNIHASDTTNEYVINETAVHAFGFKSPEDAIGKIIGQHTIQRFRIVGVVKDFHLQDFYKTIDPMAFESEKDNLSTFNIKLAGHDPAAWQATLKAIEKKWYQFYPPESFSYKFYDETLEGMYEQERHLAKLISLATGIAIFISCLGLFGLAVLTAFQRTKEIGIRKVLGASVPGIVRLLSKEYLQLVIVAIVLATPLAWWAMNKWLQNFAYRIQLQWWMFLLAGLIGIAIAMLTVSVQAIKAAVANPVKSLRTE